MQGNINFLLADLHSPINIGKIFRIAEMYHAELYIYDPTHILENEENQKIISDFACGSYQRLMPHMVENLHEFIQTYEQGRVIANCHHKGSVRLKDIIFKDKDLIMLGNEYEGLADSILELADLEMYISLPHTHAPLHTPHNPIDVDREFDVDQEGVACLNIAVAAGIIGYQYYCWQEDHEAQDSE